jgi:hypothetical protein
MLSPCLIRDVIQLIESFLATSLNVLYVAFEIEACIGFEAPQNPTFTPNPFEACIGLYMDP